MAFKPDLFELGLKGDCEVRILDGNAQSISCQNRAGKYFFGVV